MKIYNYDSITFEYTGSQNAYLDPEETKVQGKNVYLIPACATALKPPTAKEDFARVFENNAWSYVHDYRANYYKVDSLLNVTDITELGDLPEGYILVTKELGDEIKSNPNDYIIDNEEVREKTEEEKQAEEQDRINNLTMTPLDFIKVLEQLGLTLTEINEFLDTHIEIKTQLTYCNLVYCGVAKSFLPQTIGEVTITPEMAEQAFKIKNGEVE